MNAAQLEGNSPRVELITKHIKRRLRQNKSKLKNKNKSLQKISIETFGSRMLAIELV